MNPSRPRSFGEDLRVLARRVDDRLPELLPPEDELPRDVHRAMRYAALGPGKRIRPVVTLLVAELFGSSSPPILDLACSIELVHATSLILDDLPSMDDARLRRGRPTTHREFGEAVALLAAFGLLNRAYSIVAEAAQNLAPRRYSAEDMVHHLAVAIGSGGLIGGQALDLSSRPEDLDLERLERIHSGKTGALFLAAAELGAMAADARRKELDAVSLFAKNVGLAFQITDDVLDVQATTAETGKDAGQDADKVTFVKLLGVSGAQTLAEELLAFAAASLAPFGKKADPLRALALFVGQRGR